MQPWPRITRGGSSPRTWGTPVFSPAGRDRRRFIPTHVGNTRRNCRHATTGSVHPHARGEHRPARLFNGAVTGSSPRTWGTLALSDGGILQIRFIPTHVGNTCAFSTQAPKLSVHPHARGEHKRLKRRAGRVHGSSPRTWGTRLALLHRVLHLRFIPTHVGNTAATPPPHATKSVHPHARGEHDGVEVAVFEKHGSSPRTWGTLHLMLTDNHHERFIPTHVGNTHYWLTVSPWQPVHPHARGEHLAEEGGRWPHVGSSPRTWGTHQLTWPPMHPSWFIPTHVGNTNADLVHCGRLAVHPHARGEHIKVLESIVACSGSSPRTWGTRPCIQRRAVPGRFIPTHVGNTSCLPAGNFTNSVHPHARGEHKVTAAGNLGSGGSSPRTWGTLDIRKNGATSPRFIPTHVGNT